MANPKSTRAPRKSPVKQSAKGAEMVQVPFLAQPYRKAPATDPYLKPDSITSETITYGEVSLPPILSGIQPGLDLQGNPTDYRVKVIHVSRRQIDWVLREIREQHPDLDVVLQIVSRYMCHLDSVRDHAIFGLSCLKGQIKAGEVDKALESLASTCEGLGGWHDEHRLHLR